MILGFDLKIKIFYKNIFLKIKVRWFLFADKSSYFYATILCLPSWRFSAFIINSIRIESIILKPFFVSIKITLSLLTQRKL